MRVLLLVPAGLVTCALAACGGGNDGGAPPGGPHAVAFEAPVARALGLIPSVTLTLDANDDGVADVAVFGLSLAPGGASRVEVYLGVRGQGLAATPSYSDVLYPGPAVTLRPHAAVMDVQGDGVDDLIFTMVPTATESINPVAALLSRGDGTFTRSTLFDPSTPVFRGPTEDAIPLRADLNDLDDICVLFAPVGTSGVWRMALQLRDLAGDFALPSSILTLTRQPTGLHAGDLNGDDRDDVVVEYSSPPGYEVYFSNGTTLFLAVPYRESAGPDVSRGIAVAPIDTFAGDEVLALDRAGGPRALFYLAGMLVSRGPEDPNLFGDKAAPALADLSGDGLTDMVFARRTLTGDFVVAYTGLGDLTFAPTPTFLPINGGLIGSGPLTVAIGDVNGDGRPDVVYTDAGAAPGSYALRVALQE